jgi:hypothetical protein
MADRAPAAAFVENAETTADLERLEFIAEWLDRRYLDPLMNVFLPGGGSTLSSLIGLYAVFVAARLRVHPVVIARMLIHLAIDSIVGSIPVLGWLFDFFYRAHVKNLELLRARSGSGQARGSDWLVVLLAAALFLIALCLPLLLIAAAAYFVFRAV